VSSDHAAVEGGTKWRKPRLPWLLPACASALFLFEVRRFCGSALYFVDDPFISMHYAASLVQRGELSFNPGDRVEGYSNFLLVVLHALGFVLRGGVPGPAGAADQAMIVALLAAILQLAVLFGLARRSSQPYEAESTAWYYAAILTASWWSFAFWATAGLEGPIEGVLYMGLLACATSMARGKGHQGTLVVVAVLLGGVTLLRFEGVITALAVAAALGVHLARAGRRKAAIALVAAVAAPAAVYHLWRIAYFGTLLPNTFVAKATGGSLIARLQAGASYCGGWFGSAAGGFAMVVLAIAATLGRKRMRVAIADVLNEPVLLVASVLIGTKLALVVWGGGDWMPGWRMLVPITPIVFFLIFRALLAVLAERGTLRVDGLAGLALGLALILCGRQGEFQAHDGTTGEAGRLKKLPSSYVEMGETLEHAFAGSSEEVAIGEAGLVPFAAPHVRVMDLFGLIDPDMARQPGGMHRRVHVEHMLVRAPVAIAFAHLSRQPPYGPYQYGSELLPSAAFHTAYRRVDLADDLQTAGWALYLRRDVDPAAHGLAWSTSDPLRTKVLPESEPLVSQRPSRPR
jgi:hypothetical protein